ncbi:hypothetical protein EEB18_016655 [Sphingopyxis sp. OPL5]|uniref:hypothetical protein n=1 Tax=Sphingopyxis sp. OPL5 TaxID=2486273 RepID=UPI00164D1ED6|nr:hypothetical protein [Sphingopyxis sp. OPL5]QNO26375.1 hypothetical protein EEB18_016655 [Sphingopyxis sp. OPL5]
MSHEIIFRIIDEYLIGKGFFKFFSYKWNSYIFARRSNDLYEFYCPRIEKRNSFTRISGIIGFFPSKPEELSADKAEDVFNDQKGYLIYRMIENYPAISNRGFIDSERYDLIVEFCELLLNHMKKEVPRNLFIASHSLKETGSMACSFSYLSIAKSSKIIDILKKMNEESS